MKAVPITLRVANEYVDKLHRHSKSSRGCKFAVGCEHRGKFVGVAIAGRPLARMLDNGKTLEVLRVCTDGTKNACSFLYGVCIRVGREFGYSLIMTYTLTSEPGTSLIAVGAYPDAKVAAGRQWVSEDRPLSKARESAPARLRWVLWKE